MKERLLFHSNPAKPGTENPDMVLAARSCVADAMC